jgi:hypothetical protein
MEPGHDQIALDGKNFKSRVEMKASEHKSTATASANRQSQPFFSKGGRDMAEIGPDHFFNRSPVQAKLTVGQPNDTYEKEADAMADQVVQRLSVDNSVQTKPQIGFSYTPFVQMKCDACEKEEKLQKKEDIPEKEEDKSNLQLKPIFESAGRPVEEQANIQRKCQECEEEDKVQKKEMAGSGQSIGNDIENRLSSGMGSGSPLGNEIQSRMESSFGADFSNVRIHNDSASVQMSQDLHAQAFTHSNDIYFNSGKYNPESNEGKHLLAHELTHVIQQNGNIGRTAVQRKVNPSNITTNQNILNTLGLTRQQVIDTITDANADAIVLARKAEEVLTTELTNARNGDTVDANAELILTEELGLSFNNPAQHGLIRQQIQRFKTVRETLESGYLSYLALGIGSVKLIGCTAGDCTAAFAFSCPGNRLTILCQPFWNTPAEQGATLLHEPFHIWFHMAHHNTNSLRRADASCFESFALRASGRNAPPSCAAHTNG